jgi:polar amino acid transport system permease protein
VPVLDKIVGFYIELSRNTPLLIQLFFLYFGLPKVGIVLTSEQCGVIGLAFLGGSYMAEAFRSGLDNVESIQIQSALSLGMKKSQAFRYVILPQAVSNSIPAFCANIIFLIKETSVFSAVALADLMFITKDLIGIYYKTDEALFMLVIAYLIILLPISLICSLVERRVSYGRVPAGSVVVSGNLPSKDGSYSLYCAVIVKKVDAKTRAKVGINALLRSID